MGGYENKDETRNGYACENQEKEERKSARRTTATRKRTLPVAKRGGFLPLLPLLGVLGSLAGGAVGIAKAVNDGKAARRQLEELQRHHRAMEGRGLYLAPYKRGSGVFSSKKRENVKKKFRVRY